MSERAVYRLAEDLQNGNARDAAYICRNELNANPQAALQEIRQANYLAGQNAMLHIGTRQSDGDIALIDQYGRAVTCIGNAYQQGSYDSGYNNGQFSRYPGDYQNGGYQNGDYRGRYPDQRYPDQRYPDDCPDGYRQGQGYNQERVAVQRLAQDLAFGQNTREAAYLTQVLLQSPDGLRAIQSANQLADMEARQYGRYRAAEHAVTMRNGQEVIVSQDGCIMAQCGNVYEAQNMIGPRQYAPSQAIYSTWDNGSQYDGAYNDRYNGAYFRGYPQPNYYPPQVYAGINNNVGSFILGTGVGLTLSAIFRGGHGGYHRYR